MPLTNGGLVCAQGHTWAEEAGVVRLVSAEFAPRLRPYLTAFKDFRASEGKRLLDPTLYPGLPYSGEGQDRLEWRWRGYDLALITQLLAARRYLKVLDVGAWNGWLAHRLTLAGHQVTAVDYFDDEFDGRAAKKFHAAQWQAIQMDLTDLDLLNETYDVVILNRCLQFFPDPLAYVETARRRVAPGGQLILTGLQFFRETRVKQADVAMFRERLAQVGLDFLHPTKGYLDFADRARLRGLGLSFQPYPQLWRANIRARFQPTRPWHAVGVLQLP